MIQSKFSRIGIRRILNFKKRKGAKMSLTIDELRAMGRTVAMSYTVEILGTNRQRYELRNMVKALQFHSWSNSDAENIRLECGKYALNNWRDYQRECDFRRLSNILRTKPFIKKAS
jgi:hypothetical protein